MSDPNQRPAPPEGPDRRGGAPEPQGFNWKGLILLSVAIIILASGLILRSGASGGEMTYSTFIEKLDKNEVVKDSVKVMIDPAGEYLKVKLTGGGENENKEFKVPF